MTPRLFPLLLAASAVASSTHAQTTRWTTNRVGNSLYYQNDQGERGQAWESQPGVIHSETQDAAAHVRRCDTRKFGSNTIETTCH